MDTFLGHSVKYWLELERKAETLNVINWLEEIAELGSKVNFYESRIKQMNEFMNRK